MSDAWVLEIDETPFAETYVDVFEMWKHQFPGDPPEKWTPPKLRFERKLPDAENWNDCGEDEELVCPIKFQDADKQEIAGSQIKPGDFVVVNAQVLQWKRDDGVWGISLKLKSVRVMKENQPLPPSSDIDPLNDI